MRQDTYCGGDPGHGRGASIHTAGDAGEPSRIGHVAPVGTAYPDGHSGESSWRNPDGATDPLRACHQFENRTSDRHLISACPARPRHRRGSDQVLRLLQPDIRRYARKQCHQTSAIEDVVQEAMTCCTGASATFAIPWRWRAGSSRWSRASGLPVLGLMRGVEELTARHEAALISWEEPERAVRLPHAHGASPAWRRGVRPALPGHQRAARPSDGGVGGRSRCARRNARVPGLLDDRLREDHPAEVGSKSTWAWRRGVLTQQRWPDLPRALLRRDPRPRCRLAPDLQLLLHHQPQLLGRGALR